MIFVIIFVIALIVIFALTFGKKESSHIEKHKQYKELKGKTFSNDDKG